MAVVVVLLLFFIVVVVVFLKSRPSGLKFVQSGAIKSSVGRGYNLLRDGLSGRSVGKLGIAYVSARLGHDN